MIKLKSKNNYIYILVFFISLIGIYTYKDYGLGIEEHLQRKSGFYWLNYLLNFTDFEILKKTAEYKLEQIKIFSPRLTSIEEFGFYGILFDVPLAFIETFFQINNPSTYFYLRHLLIFFLFLISAFCFYKIIINRFKNINVALIGFIFFIFSPRIYGNIFFDSKDILFLSIFTINMYYFLNYLKKKDTFSLIIFSVFCALSTSSRIIGLLIPFTFLILLMFEFLNLKNLNLLLKKLIVFLIFYLLALFIHWPYLWTLDYVQFSNFFNPFFYAMNPMVFFNGNFYQSKFLPYSYLPLWIVMTTPFYITIFFCIGFFNNFKRVFKRLINIKENSYFHSNDLWRSKKENFDFFIFFNFLSVILLYLTINPALLQGWRHFYFLNFFIIYFSCYFLYMFYFTIKKKKFENYLKISLIFISIFIIFENYKYHPFQSSYFNNFITDNKKKDFEIDSQSLSRVHAIRELLKEEGDIYLGTASFSPLENARSLIPVKEWKRLKFVGTEFSEANYIYSNYYYEVNVNYNKKYEIPKNFSLYKTLIIDGTRIYTIYKKL